MDAFDSFFSFFTSATFRFVISIMKVFLVIFWISLAFWTYRDAKRRGGMAGYWGIVVLLFSVFGFFIYLILRPPEFFEEARERELEIKAKEALISQADLVCPACMKQIDKEFIVCPYCLKKLKKSCPSCEHALKLNWTICPYCQSNT